MPNLNKGKDCCGCTACMAVCPKDAITMQPDALGFKYPVVDYNKCIECKACERVCAFNDRYDTSDNFSTPKAYGVRLKNMDEVMKSRSGGAFVAFSDWILNQGGVVYGAGYEGHFVVTHKRAITSEQRDEFRGSKYVQSNLDGIFRSVRDDLKAGRWVLFSGTPCQTAGLRSFIPKKLQEKLLVVDIVCHGVPAPNIWKDYLVHVEKKENGEVVAVNFRDKKDFGWKAHKELLTIKKNRSGEVVQLPKTGFTYLFHQHIIQRESCGICHYTNLRRPSDLTLADFWGWERTGNRINSDDKGLSLVLVNSELGQKVFDEVKYNFNSFESSLENCMQNCLLAPRAHRNDSEEVKQKYASRGFDYFYSRYGNEGWRFKLKNLSRRICNKLKV